MTSSTLISQPVEQQVEYELANQLQALHLSDRLFASVKQHYQADHQAEYLNLTAAAESLLAQVQAFTPEEQAEAVDR